MLARVKGFEEVVAAGKVGLIVLAVAFVVAVVATVFAQGLGRRRPRWCGRLEDCRLDRTVGNGLRREQLGLLACLAGVALLAAYAITHPVVLLVAHLLLPMVVLFIMGYSFRKWWFGRLLCILALCATVPVPAIWQDEFSNPVAVFAAFAAGATAITGLLLLDSRRRAAGEAEWIRLERRIKRGSTGSDGAPAGAIQSGDRARRKHCPDRMELAERVKAKGVCYRIP